MKHMRRLGSILLVWAVVLSMCCTDVSAEEERFAYGELGNNVTASGLILSAGTNGNAEHHVVEKDGKFGWQMKPVRNDQPAIYVNLENTFAYKLSDYSSYEVEVEYFDEGEGKFRIRYDALPDPWRDKGDKRDNQIAVSDIVTSTDTGKWKTATVRLEYPRFADGLNGYDFCITTHEENMGLSMADVTFRSITVRPVGTKASVRAHMSSDALGNNFFSGEAVKMAMDVYNMSKKDEKVTVTAKSVDFDHNTYDIGSYDLEIPAGKSVRRDIEFTPERYSTYTLYYEISGEGISSKGKTEYAYCLQNDKLNPNLCYNEHHYSWPKEPEKLIPLMKKAGISGTREDDLWSLYELQTGQFVVSEKSRHVMEVYEQYGLDQMVILIAGRNDALGAYGLVDDLPVSEAAQEAFLERFVRPLAIKNKGKHTYFELFNELNFHTGNGHDAEWYGKLARKVYKVIKEVDPNYKLAIGASAGASMDWITTVIKSAEGCFDEYSFHYYGHSNSRDSGFYNAAKGVRTALDENGAADIPLSVSETGHSSSQQIGFSSLTTEPGYRMQAERNAQLYATLMSPELKIRTIYYYDFQDDGYYPEDGENNFGAIRFRNTIDTPYIAKPTYLTIAAVNHFLTGAEVVDKQELETASCYKFKRDDGKDIMMVWSYRDSEYFTASLGSDDVEVFDMYGNKLDVYRKNGIYSIALDEQPVYFVGNFTKYELEAEPIFTVSGTEFDMPYGDIVDIEITKAIDDNAAVEVVLPDDGYVEVYENKGFAGNKAVVRLSAKGETGKKAVARLIVKGEDGKTFLNEKIVLSYTDATVVNFRTEPYNDKNLGRWIGVITIKNNKHVEPIKGRILFNAPNELSEKIKYVEVPEIAPNTEKEIRFNMPEVEFFRSYFIDADLKLDNGYSQHLNIYADCCAAVYAYEKPVIDGTVSENEWRGGKELWLGEGNEYELFTSYKGDSDLSGNIKYMWDEDNLYMLCQMTDDIFYQKEAGSGIWSGDSVQIGVYYGQIAHNDQRLFTELGFALTPNGPFVAKYSTEPGATVFTEHQGEAEMTQLAVTRNGKLTTYEARIPWAELLTADAPRLTLGESVRFNMIVNDNDGAGRWGWVEYGSGIGVEKDGTQFGYLRLMDNNKK